MLDLRCCIPAFFGCGKQWLLLVVVHRLLIVVASPVAEHQVLGAQASLAAAHEL